MFASQDGDGYFGPKCLKRWQGKDGRVLTDLWPHMVMLDPLISHEESSGDPRLLPLLTRFFEFCGNLPEEMFVPAIDWGAFGDWRPIIQAARAGDMIAPLHWLYNRTGDRHL